MIRFIFVPMRGRKDVSNSFVSLTYQLRRRDDVSAWSTTSRPIWGPKWDVATISHAWCGRFTPRKCLKFIQKVDQVWFYQELSPTYIYLLICYNLLIYYNFLLSVNEWQCLWFYFLYDLQFHSIYSHQKNNWNFSFVFSISAAFVFCTKQLILSIIGSHLRCPPVVPGCSLVQKIFLFFCFVFFVPFFGPKYATYSSKFFSQFK